jgi:hypothetical protein
VDCGLPGARLDLQAHGPVPAGRRRLGDLRPATAGRPGGGACPNGSGEPSTISQVKQCPSANMPAAQPPSEQRDAPGATVVPMVPDGGTFGVPVRINDQITLKFVIDSGASDVSVPADVVMTLLRTGTITDADFQFGRTC